MALAKVQLDNAVKYNTERGREVGWLAHEETVLKELGFPSHCPTSEVFANAVADWQSRQRPPLKPDGKLGPDTWRRMRTALRLTPSGGAIATEPIQLAGSGPVWLQVAQAERNVWDAAIGTMSAKQAKIAEFHMTRDEQYFMASPYFGGRVKDAGVIPNNKGRYDWCAAFVNWCLHRAGYSHSGSAGAHSFVVPRLWRFTPLTEPRQGCVVVVGNGERGAHVAFIWDWKNLPSDPKGHVTLSGSRKLDILGGNQGQRISIKRETRRMLAARGENGVTSPYLWPERGAPSCNHLPDSLQAHFCGNTHS